ncbi:MAG TPA: hypothetical protein VIO58_08730 [Candidatus Methanoperedens sp.]
MMQDFVFFFTGISGLLILYIVLAHLSARMCEGMGLPSYYLLYFIAILALILTLPQGWQIYFEQKDTSSDILFILMIIGNTIAITASFRYWWWLKDELLNKNMGGKTDE